MLSGLPDSRVGLAPHPRTRPAHVHIPDELLASTDQNTLIKVSAQICTRSIGLAAVKIGIRWTWQCPADSLARGRVGGPFIIFIRRGRRPEVSREPSKGLPTTNPYVLVALLLVKMRGEPADDVAG